MNRSRPLARRTPLAADPAKTGAWADRSRRPLPDRKNRLAQVAPTKRAVRAKRADLVASLTAAGIHCEICPELARHGIRLACPSTISGLHERRKRSSAGSLIHPDNLTPCCSLSNGWVEDTLPIVAHDLPTALVQWLVVRSGDPDWDHLSSRASRITPPPPVTVRHCPVCATPFLTVPPSRHLTCGHPLPCQSAIRPNPTVREP